jgi:repressor LexA
MGHQRRDRRRDVLRFVTGFVYDNGYGPTCDEISAAVGLSSKSHAAYYLGILERDGLVERKPYSPRGLRVTGLPHVADPGYPAQVSR